MRSAAALERGSARPFVMTADRLPDKPQAKTRKADIGDALPEMAIHRCRAVK
jgi:hypothetical protein